MPKTSNQQGGHFPVFHGGRFQRGYGLGSFFKSLARSAMPLMQRGAKTIGKTALTTGMNIARDVMAGDNLATSAKTQLKAAAGQLKRKALTRINSQTGSGAKRRKKTLIKRKSFKNQLTSTKTGKGKRAKLSGGDILD